MAELLGFERAMTAPWSDAATARLTMGGAAELLGDELTPEMLREAAAPGYIDIDGDAVHVSKRLLDTTAALVGEGIPLPAILATGRELQQGLDAMAWLFVDLVVSHVVPRPGEGSPPREVARLAETIRRLRPVARAVIDEEFARAMDRHEQRLPGRDYGTCAASAPAGLAGCAPSAGR